MVSAPFVHSGVEGMELGHGGPTYGQGPVDPNFPGEPVGREGHGIFRSSSDVAGALGRVESRAKARERARERAKEKHYTEREPDVVGSGAYAPSSAAGHLVAPQYANLPSQVSSALQHPFQAPFPTQAGNNQPGSSRQAPYHASYFAEAYSSPPFGGYPPPPYAHPEPSLISISQSHASVSQYFVENPNPPSPMGGGRYSTGNTNPNFSGFSPGPLASSSRASPFASLLSDPGYPGYPNQPGYFPFPFSNQQPRPSPFPGPAPASRLPPGQGYPPPSSHLVRPGHDRQNVHSTPHSLDPNFYNPQIPTSLEAFEELEEEFKR